MRFRVLFQLIIITVLCGSSIELKAQDWVDGLENLIYTPRYFGPNAFPISELRSGRIGQKFEVEARGEYHYYSGDKTHDLYVRGFMPIAKGLAGVEVSYIIREKYDMTRETADERFAYDTKSPINCHGDVVISTFFQVLKSEKWVDLIVTANLKSASGNRLVDARYTDAATYWFDLQAGRNIYKSEDESFTLRGQAMIGFYCWMTNDIVHRQNDALLYGVGLNGDYKQLSMSLDCSGFSGYEKNGDRPITFRSKINYEFHKNIISFRYKHGMKDNLYDTYSLGYIRCF